MLRTVGPSTVAEIADDLRLSRDEARGVVNALAAGGYVDLRGAGRGRRAHLSTTFHRLSRSQSATVRVRDPEPIQQREMVLRFVREYGSIARKEAAELCKLSDDSASRLLRAMAADGLLTMRGSRRTARYAAPAGADDSMGAPRD